MSGLLIRGADLGPGLADVRVEGETIVDVGPGLLRRPREPVLEAAGGALLPGLHDHHVHLYASAAARRSVELGPPAVRDAGGFAAALTKADRALPAGEWVRGTGYHEAVAGPLDRRRLDAVLGGRPVRVQHRSGSEWVLNTAALRRLPPGLLSDARVERDAAGRLTGRLRRMDDRLAEEVPRAELDLAALSRAALEAGVTGLTDATPLADRAGMERLIEAVRRGEIRQRLTLMQAPVPPRRAVASLGDEVTGVSLGPVKILLDDDALPPLHELGALVAEVHAGAWPVAVHCVTRAQSVLALAALADAGVVAGDRVEHGALIPVELVAEVARLGLTVVTNPGFVAARGDAYLAEVDPSDRPHLWRARSLIGAGVALAAGTDAPFGPADPWRVIAAATNRRTPKGATLGPAEALSGRRALGLFLGRADAPAVERAVRPGHPADLVVLGVPLRHALERPTADHVCARLIGGRLVEP